MAHGRYDLTEFEWNVIKPLLPNKARGVPRVDDRRVLNGIFLSAKVRFAFLPERYGPYTTVYNRFNRWRKADVSGTGSWMQSSRPMRPKARSCK